MFLGSAPAAGRLDGMVFELQDLAINDAAPSQPAKNGSKPATNGSSYNPPLHPPADVGRDAPVDLPDTPQSRPGSKTPFSIFWICTGSG